jgi:hypothetical protein
MAARRGTPITTPPQQSATGDPGSGGNGGNGGSTNIWSVFSDLIAAGADVAKSVVRKPGQESGVTFVPASGLDAGLLKMVAIVIIGLVILRMVKGR